MDSIRKKIDYYTHTIWGRWVCNAIVAVLAIVAMKALLEYGLTMKHCLLQDFLYNKEIEVETFTKYAPLIVAAVTLFLPGAGPVAVGLTLFMTTFAVCPYLIALATLALLFAAPANKVIKALAMLMPVAIMQFTAEQMDKLGASNQLLTISFAFCLMFIIVYASHMADKVPYAMSTPILFVTLAVPAGFFGKIKHISFMKSYWLNDKSTGYFKEGIDNYALDHLLELLIMLVALLIVVIVFTKLLTTKKTALAGMQRDKRDAIAFGITTILLIGALLGIKAGLKLETMEINYLMIVVQMLIAFVVTRFITMHDESLNVADEEKLKKFSKVTGVLSILAIVAALGFGGYYYYTHKDDIAPSGADFEHALELAYEAENDDYGLPFGTFFDEDQEIAWFKLVSRSSDRKCVAVFDKSEGQKMVKSANVYDETGENLISEMPQYSDGEKPFQSWDFETVKDGVYYIKVEFGEHTGKDEMLVHGWVEFK